MQGQYALLFLRIPSGKGTELIIIDSGLCLVRVFLFEDDILERCPLIVPVINGWLIFQLLVHQGSRVLVSDKIFWQRIPGDPNRSLGFFI